MNACARISAAMLLAAVASIASATNYTWDASGGSPPDDGAGTWNTTGTNWFDGATYGAWGNTTSDVAFFGVGNGAAGTITVGSVTLNGITFNNAGSGNYTLTSGTLAFGGTNPTITANATGTSIISSGVTGSAGLLKNGSGTLMLSGPAAVYTGTTAVTDGTMIFRDTTSGNPFPGATGFKSRIAVSPGATIVSERTVAGFANRAAILGSANSFSSDPWITGTGVLNVNNAANPAGTADGGWTIVLGEDALTMSGTVNVNSGVLSRDGAGLVFNTKATFNVAEGAVFGAARAGNSIIGGLNGAGSVAALFLGGGGRLTVGNGNSSGSFSGALRGNTIGGNFTLDSGVLTLQKIGTGTQTLSGSSTYSGTTSINAGVLNIQNSNALGNTDAGTTVANGAALELQGGIAVGAEALTLAGSGSGGGALRNISGDNSYAGSVTLAAASRINSDAGTLTLSSAGTLTGNFNLTFGGAGNVFVARAIATGANSVTKDGSGTLMLSGTNLYSGGTQIDAGQLTVDGTLGTSDVTVASGATLGGSGVINAPVTVLSGGIVAPGNSFGTLTVNGPYSLADLSILNFELDPTNTTVGGGFNDLITGVTDLTLDGILNISGTGDWTAAASNSSWRLFNYSGALTNNVLTLGTTPSLGDGRSFQVDTSTANQVNLVIVPEPAASGVAGIGIAAAAAWAARRCRRG